MSFLLRTITNSRPSLPCLPSTSVLKSFLFDNPLPGKIELFFYLLIIYFSHRSHEASLLFMDNQNANIIIGQ